MKKRSLFQYTGSIPDILRYQIITKLILLALIWSVRLARSAVIWTAGRGEVITGDVKYWLTSVQGWIVISITLFLLIMYVIFDINATIVLSYKVIHQEKISVRKILGEAVGSIRRFRGPLGWFILLYAAFLVPLAGVGMGISLTNGFYIPKFILSYLDKRPMIQSVYTVVLAIMILISAYFMFTFHCIIIGKMPAKKAVRRAGKMMHQNWKNFLPGFLRYLLSTLAVGVLCFAVWTLMCYGVGRAAAPENELYYRILLTFLSFMILAGAAICILLFLPVQMMAITKIYESYTEEDEGELKYPNPKPRKRTIVMSAVLIVLIALASVMGGMNFDEAFPSFDNTLVVSHRCGGNMAAENTVTGLEKAIEVGADSAEIDIQRTADGYYIVNHDNTFKRLAGDEHYSDELTLEEIKELRITKDKNSKGVEDSFATLEEILETAKDQIHIYIEFKGKTADFRMASDAYWIAAQYGMLDQVTFISMKYSVVSYLESKHPDADTGYLCYSAFGDISQLNVDGIYLEEEMATPVTIGRIHAAGKLAFVWTVNEPFSMIRYYARNADGIITDDVKNAVGLRDFLQGVGFDEDSSKQLEYMIRIMTRVVFEYWP